MPTRKAQKELRARHRPRSIAIVGNAPDMGDQAGRIDAADWVVRFNNASGFGGRAGGRVTHLALVNHGGQMREWLTDPGFLDRPFVSGAQTFVFPFARKAEPVEHQGEDGRDWTDEAETLLRPVGAPVEILPPSVRREAAALLGRAPATNPVPSTGFLVALHLVRRFGGTATIDVHGFGFEGWEGHAWARERQWFEAMTAGGFLRVHPLDRAFAA
ncbi:hypothetical protein [Aureimonas sp. ME7]|uniref:hypothetical protein n=1 Tax=Aureimonas sp. ME7 TaxID=2744252 RepID=UPI0015F466FD|nr:hypothetical protein [Aureimonas sp. ME7]